MAGKNHRELARDPEVYVGVAREIWGGEPPEWLGKHLERWGPSLFLDRQVGEKQPTRAKMRLVLKHVRSAAALAGRALGSAAVLDFLQAPPNGPFADLGRLSRDLADLARRAEQARNSSALATETGVTKSGAGKASIDEAMTPMTYCAVLISEAWKYRRGSAPLPKSAGAARAAEAYWCASGGHPLSVGEDSLARWLHHFRLAEQTEAPLRSEIRRHLAMSEQHFKILSHPPNTTE